jgi:ribosomal protein L32
MARKTPNVLATKCQRCGQPKKRKRFCRNCLYGKAAQPSEAGKKGVA